MTALIWLLLLFMMTHGTDGSCTFNSSSYPGILLRPKKKVFQTSELLVMQCGKDGNLATATCKSDGTWSRDPPPCKVTQDEGCEYRDQFRPYKWSLYHYKYVNISIPKQAGNSNKDSTITSMKGISDSTTSGFQAINSSPAELTARKEVRKWPLNTKVSFMCESGYTLIGPPQIVCDVGYQWSFKCPFCKQDEEVPEKQAINYKLTIIWSSITILSILILIASSLLIYKWRQRILQRKQWQRYFGDYTYRQSKTRITRPASSSGGTKAERGNRKSSSAQAMTTTSGVKVGSSSAAASSAAFSAASSAVTSSSSDVQVKSNEDTATIYSTATITSVSTTMTSITQAGMIGMAATTVTITSPSPDLNEVVSPPSPSAIASDTNNPVYANITLDNNSSNCNNINLDSNPLESPTLGLSEQELKSYEYSRRCSPVVPVTDL